MSSRYLLDGILNRHSVVINDNRGYGPRARAKVRSYIGTATAKQEEALKGDGCISYVFNPKAIIGLTPCTCSKELQALVNPGSMDTVDDILNFKPVNPVEHELELLNMNPEDILDKSLINTGGMLNNRKCGICFGTLYKDSFDLVNGKLLTLDSYNFVSMDGFEIEPGVKPLTYKSILGKFSTITFKIPFNRFFSSIDAIAVCNNTTEVKNSKIELSIDNINWEIFSTSWFTNLKNNKEAKELFIKVTPICDTKVITRITHVLLLVSFGKKVLLDFPLISDTINFDFFESVQTANLEFPGWVSVKRGAFIVETKNKLIWKVTSVTPIYSSAGQLYISKVVVRRVQNIETPYFLNTLINKKPFIPLNFKGLETQPGLRHYDGQKYDW